MDFSHSIPTLITSKTFVSLIHCNALYAKAWEPESELGGGGERPRRSGKNETDSKLSEMTVQVNRWG